MSYWSPIESQDTSFEAFTRSKRMGEKRRRVSRSCAPANDSTLELDAPRINSEGRAASTALLFAYVVYAALACEGSAVSMALR